jgi:HD-GYP domain-containing protein (c-di-GMP phosphodiesterase class II)
MMSDRPYRAALGLDKAINELERGKGTEFDPAAVEAFVELVEKDQLDLPR